LHVVRQPIPTDVKVEVVVGRFDGETAVIADPDLPPQRLLDVTRPMLSDPEHADLAAKLAPRQRPAPGHLPGLPRQGQGVGRGERVSEIISRIMDKAERADREALFAAVQAAVVILTDLKHGEVPSADDAFSRLEHALDVGKPYGRRPLPLPGPRSRDFGQVYDVADESGGEA
jgi:hypothetical protein